MCAAGCAYTSLFATNTTNSISEPIKSQSFANISLYQHVSGKVTDGTGAAIDCFITRWYISTLVIGCNLLSILWENDRICQGRR
jgi:hypothetical protein